MNCGLTVLTTETNHRNQKACARCSLWIVKKRHIYVVKHEQQVNESTIHYAGVTTYWEKSRMQQENMSTGSEVDMDGTDDAVRDLWNVIIFSEVRVRHETHNLTKFEVRNILICSPVVARIGLADQVHAGL